MSEEACKTNIQYNEIITELPTIAFADFVSSLIFGIVVQFLGSKGDN